ncbi:peptidoglycan-binding domain-containing protein [Polaribacter sp. PL03]|uniref:peptidoglycan-binding domain-containing protein n=1 Tax=Polaribacter sp. PL03 TaxID=3088353 RepID=UPI0029CB82F9|nr:peptidoglycan-binding domain-containing protein [Polaribacter sp. PL03]MDX6746298.1 peptidoglycan-binding domain-containing protein [Polaribacter sp. PL03]
MKQIIIILLLVITFFIGYGKYKQYKRYNSPEVSYKVDKRIDLEYHNQEFLMNYNKAIEDLNSFVMLQWTANDIDVRTPEDDDNETKNAVNKYADKLAIVKYFENKLEKSAILKENGLTNLEIKFLEETGTNLKSHQESLAVDKIKRLFNSSSKIKYGEKSPLIYEVQKKLIAKGYKITKDGVFKEDTINILKIFEEKNNLFADGYLDLLTLDALYK